MTHFTSIILWAAVVWAVLKILDFIIEFVVSGRITPADVMWWLCRPISFRSFGIRFPLLLGIVIWVVLLVLAVLGVQNLIA